MEETFEFEGTQYVNPTISRDEQLGFIDNLRAVQNQNNEQIKQDTYNLGTQTTSNLGGLTGAEGKWQAEYQTPQINYTVDNLKSVAQQSALNTALSNLQNAWQNRYNQAQRAYVARQNSGGTSGGTAQTEEGNVVFSDSQIDTTTTQSGEAKGGWAYIATPNGGDRWYKLNPDGSIDYNTYVSKDPDSRKVEQADKEEYSKEVQQAIGGRFAGRLGW